jgi:hypothetical protein
MYPFLVGWPQVTINGPERDSSASAYLAEEYLRRENLHVMVNTRVTRVLRTGANSQTPEFKSVEYLSDGGSHYVNCIL